MAEEDGPQLGLATTRQLIEELMARAQVATTAGEAWPSYRTTGPKTIHQCETPFWRTDDGIWRCPICHAQYIWTQTKGESTGGGKAIGVGLIRNLWRVCSPAEYDKVSYEWRHRPESKFFTPLDDPEGEGHCQSCHHDCRFEDCDEPEACTEPHCGHWIGCPGC